METKIVKTSPAFLKALEKAKIAEKLAIKKVLSK